MGFLAKSCPKRPGAGQSRTALKPWDPRYGPRPWSMPVRKGLGMRARLASAKANLATSWFFVQPSQLPGKKFIRAFFSLGPQEKSSGSCQRLRSQGDSSVPETGPKLFGGRDFGLYKAALPATLRNLDTPHSVRSPKRCRSPGDVQICVARFVFSPISPFPLARDVPCLEVMLQVPGRLHALLPCRAQPFGKSLRDRSSRRKSISFRSHDDSQNHHQARRQDRPV